MILIFCEVFNKYQRNKRETRLSQPESKTRSWQFKKSLEKYEQIEFRSVLTHHGHAGCNPGEQHEQAGRALESQQWDPLTWD